MSSCRIFEKRLCIYALTLANESPDIAHKTFAVTSAIQAIRNARKPTCQRPARQPPTERAVQNFKIEKWLVPHVSGVQVVCNIYATFCLIELFQQPAGLRHDGRNDIPALRRAHSP